jgi:four helix bundle protein
MAKIERFEDIIAWKKARILCKVIKGFTRKPEFSKDFKLSGQILDSSGSVMDNIAEGFERGGNKEFVQFLFIAKGSCGEVKSQLYRAVDSAYIDESEFQDAYNKADEIGKIIEGFIDYLQNSDLKGRKFNRDNKTENKNIK